MNRVFPPTALADLSRESASQFMSLLKAIERGTCTVALGAGASASMGLPSWNSLLRKIALTYFCHWEFEKEQRKTDNRTPPRNLSIAFWEDFHWSDSAKQHAAALLRCNPDPLTVAQMIKARVRSEDWIYLVRKALYGDEGPPALSPLLEAIGSLSSSPKLAVEILNYNYDNSVEDALSASQVRFNSIWEPRQFMAAGTVPIYHVHGYLKHGGGPTVPIILGEEDYHEYAVNQYGWRNTLQLQQFSRSVCLFVGFSCTDPQVRRLLWVAKQTRGLVHYVFLPSATCKDETTDMLESLTDAQLRNLNLRVIRYPNDEHDHRRLTELLVLLGNVIANPSVLWK